MIDSVVAEGLALVRAGFDVPLSAGNLALVCTHHHRLVERGDWQIVMTHGRPHWLPPPWLDPARQPILNRANHLPKIDFGQAAYSLA